MDKKNAYIYLDMIFFESPCRCIYRNLPSVGASNQFGDADRHYS